MNKFSINKNGNGGLRHLRVTLIEWAVKINRSLGNIELVCKKFKLTTTRKKYVLLCQVVQHGYLINVLNF